MGAVNVFEALGVSASLFDGARWRRIHGVPDVAWFEVEHGVKVERHRYNQRSIARATRAREIVLGQHAGLCDLFVPVVSDDRVLAVLVTGPFATARPTAGSLLERWQWLTGRQGHASDPEFRHFVTMELATLVLEADQLRLFERVLGLMTGFLAGHAQADPSLVDELCAKLERIREVEQMWEAARSLVDERTNRSWLSADRQPWKLGIERLPEHVLVAFAMGRDPARDAVEELIERHAFQRACANLARRTKHVVAGQVGDRGVMFLSAAKGAHHHKRQQLTDLGDKAALLARERGFRLHTGLGSAKSATLAENFRAALASAENALSRGVRLVEASERPAPARFAHYRAEQKLRETAGQHPSDLPAHLANYLQAVALGYGHALEPVRTHLAAMFERLVADLADAALISDATVRELYQELEPATFDARTIAELFEAYQHGAASLSDALRRPAASHRDRSLNRGLRFVQRHYHERLTLAQVARVAGFAPNYFSALLKTREKVTFEHYVQKLRIERAKLLLCTLELDVQQVARLSGFRSPRYFSRAFQRVVGITPLEYRRTRN
jgi:AraC-like DNA-binding protein